MKLHKVYLVGAGPGRPDLITVRGLNILREADVVIYDYLVGKEILKKTKEGAELIRSDGRKGLIIKKIKEGKRVVRLKGGDPSVFSRYSQESEALVKNKIEFEIVPGVTAASAASAFTGVPLTDRRFSSSVVFVTGHEDPKKKKSLIDWEKVSGCGTLVLYMAVENISEIVNKLLTAGKSKDTPVIVVSRAGSLYQRIVKGRLKDIAEKVKKENITAPAIIIIGKVAELEKDFNWLRKNKQVLFTGLSEERFFTDGTYFHLPLIKIEPMEDYKKFDKYIQNIKKFDWIVFTSRYGVEYFFQRLKKNNYDSRSLNNIKIAAIGNSTKTKLVEFGILADLVPEKESSEGLIERFKKLNLEGKNIFLPRSDISDKGLAQKFEKLGANTVTSFAYRNVMPKDLPDLNLKTFDEIIFTSPSTVRNFKKRYKKAPKGVKIRWIGTVTKREIKKCRLLD